MGLTPQSDDTVSKDTVITLSGLRQNKSSFAYSAKFGQNFLPSLAYHCRSHVSLAEL